MKNSSCVPYDPLTLQYNDSHDGEKLRYVEERQANNSNVAALAFHFDLRYERITVALYRYADDMVRYRAKVRARNMQKHGDTRCGYNIINGQLHDDKGLDDPPTKSDYLRHYEEQKDGRK